MNDVDRLTHDLAAAHADREASAADWGAHEDAKARLLMALAAFGPAASAAAPVVLAVLHDEHAYRDTRYHAKKALAAMGREAARVLVEDIARSPTWEALDALGEIGGEDLAAVETLPPVLADVLRGEDLALARLAAWSAMRMGPAAAPLVDVLAAVCAAHTSDDDSRLFDYAVETLVNIGAPAEVALRGLVASAQSYSADVERMVRQVSEHQERARRS